MYVYEYIFKKLVEKNVKHVFMYSGGAIMSLIDQFHPSKNKSIKTFINSNENHSVSSAVGYSKILNYLEPKKNHTGVVITTSGPGLTNCVSGILDANTDSTPLIVISGQVAIKAIGKNAFQEAPSTQITKSITKKNFFISDPNQIISVMEDAFITAHDKKKGAVHIDIPKCVLNSKITDKSIINLNYLHKITQFKESEISEIADLINSAKQPVFYIGKGASDCYELIEKISQKAKIHTSTTLHALGTFNENSLLALKMMGMHGSYQANMAIQNSDLLICLGGRFDDRCVGNVEKYAPNAKKIVFVNICQSEFNRMISTDKFPVINIESDCLLFLKHIEPYIKEKSLNWDFFKKITLWKNKYIFDKQKFFSHLNSILHHKYKNQEINIVTGVGNHQMYAAQYINFDKYIKLISSGSLGNMESGLPNAIGVKIARPNSKTICIIGDASFHMSSNDLYTIRKYNLDIKIFVMDNKSQDMVRCWEELFYDGRITATEIPVNISFQNLANAYGLAYQMIDTLAETTIEIQKKIYDSLQSSGPILVQVKCKQDFCFPLVKPGSGLDEMILSYDNQNMILSNDNQNNLNSENKLVQAPS
jgi:acetolactate synthase-1/2/3 large subunit